MNAIPLPADVTATITNLINLIRSNNNVPVATLTRAFEGLVQAGVSISEGRQSPAYGPAGRDRADMRPAPEIRSNASTPDSVAAPGPDDCGAVFKAPRDARNQRTLSPCMLTRGHPGKHANGYGTTWGGTSVSKPMRVQRDGTPVEPAATPARPATPADLAARMERARSAMATPQPPAGISSYRVGDTPVQRAQQAIRLSAAPAYGWMESQLRTVLEQLERAGTDLIRHAEKRDSFEQYNHKRMQTLRRQLVCARAALLQADTRRQELEACVNALRTAIPPVADPLDEQERNAVRFARQLAAVRQAHLQPKPQATPHPWFPGGSVA